MEINYNTRIVVSLLAAIAVVSCDDLSRFNVESDIYVNHESLDMFIGDEVQLTVNPQDGSVYEWSSVDPTIATVDNTGLVTAVSMGETTVYVRYGEKKESVAIAVKEKIETQDIYLSKEKMMMFPGTKEIITVSIVPEDANDIEKNDYSWSCDDESVALVSANGEIKAISSGHAVVTYRRGHFVRNIEVDVVNTLPFNGPHTVSKGTPLNLYLRDFDLGGVGNAYMDSDEQNTGGNNYREANGDNSSPGVDIYPDGSVVSIYGNEWLLYTIEVEDAGTYGIQVSTAGTADGQMIIEVDGDTSSGNLLMPTSGDWSQWKWGPEKPYEVELTEGRHTVRLVFSAPAYNVNEMRIEFIK